MRRLLLFWKPVCITFILTVSFTAFLNSDMLTHVTTSKIPSAIYYSLSLFVLGGPGIGLPQESSPLLEYLLWACYFLAPMLTLSVVYEFIQKQLLNRVPRRLAGHTILCGMGRNGRLIYELIRETDKNHKIVIIEKGDSNPYAQQLAKDPATWWVQNDFTRKAVLQSARVDKAARIIFSTHQDLDNLNAVVELQSHRDTALAAPLFCHLGDLEMLDNFQQTLFREPAYSCVHVFNGYQSATKRLYQRLRGERFFAAEGTVFILFGFGRFARMLFTHILQDPARTANDEILIVTDRPPAGFDFEQVWRTGRENESCSCVIHEPIINDMHLSATWTMLERRVLPHAKPILAFVCRDNDIANLDLAISIKLRGPQRLREATFICRMYAKTVKDLSDMLDHRLTPRQSKDVLLFPLEAELKAAFFEEIIQVAA